MKRFMFYLMMAFILISPTRLFAYTKAELLNYLGQVGNTGNIISGHHIKAADKRYYLSNPGDDEIVRTHENTHPSIWVGMYSTDLGVFISGLLDYDPPWFIGTNDLVDKMTDYYHQGGILELCAHMNNPQSGGPSHSKVSSIKVLIDSSIDPSAYQAYWDRLNDYASYLQKFKERGIPVMWRPFHEMNGDWFWWGDYGADDWGSDLATVWRQMYDFFVEQKDLDNLIWIYSPDGQTRPENALDAWPGDNFVDVVGIDFYNKLSLPDKRAKALIAWNLLKGKNKPMAFTEVGPLWDAYGTYDYVKDFLEPVKQYFPEAVFFNTWYDHWGPMENVHHNELYQDPYVLNRGELKIDGGTPSVPSAPTNLKSTRSSLK